MFDPVYGTWYWALGAAGGGFTYPATGAWSPAWTLYPADFDGDGDSDLLLYDASDGDYVIAMNTGTGFTYMSNA